MICKNPLTSEARNTKSIAFQCIFVHGNQCKSTIIIKNDSHQIRREDIVGTNARISAPRNTSRWLNINTYTIYDRGNLSRSFESVPNASNRSVFDAPGVFQVPKSGHLEGWTRNQWYPMKWSFWARIFMDFPFQPQLVTTLAPSSRRVWECWDKFLLVPARDLAI